MSAYMVEREHDSMKPTECDCDACLTVRALLYGQVLAREERFWTWVLWVVAFGPLVVLILVVGLVACLPGWQEVWGIGG